MALTQDLARLTIVLRMELPLCLEIHVFLISTEIILPTSPELPIVVQTPPEQLDKQITHRGQVVRITQERQPAPLQDQGLPRKGLLQEPLLPPVIVAICSLELPQSVQRGLQFRLPTAGLQGLRLQTETLVELQRRRLVLARVLQRSLRPGSRECTHSLLVLRIAQGPVHSEIVPELRHSLLQLQEETIPVLPEQVRLREQALLQERVLLPELPRRQERVVLPGQVAPHGQVLQDLVLHAHPAQGDHKIIFWTQLFSRTGFYPSGCLYLRESLNLIVSYETQYNYPAAFRRDVHHGDLPE